MDNLLVLWVLIQQNISQTREYLLEIVHDRECLLDNGTISSIPSRCFLCRKERGAQIPPSNARGYFTVKMISKIYYEPPFFL